MPRSDTNRELGRFYTPEAIALGMVRACLDAWLCRKPSLANRAQDLTCRVLDPACGDGAFLLAIFDELARRREPTCRSAAQRLAIVRDQIFGVDIDPPAVAALRSRLLERIDPPNELAPEAASVIAQNIRCGDSLTGPDFSGPPVHQLGLWTQESGESSDAVAWPIAFPGAANLGGFDVIVGNPPYVRERNAKELFDRLAVSELSRRWREQRMDLWYYFLHRSLDLLRSGGVLAFIVNSYWMSSRGAARLINRLERETVFEEIQLLNDAPVFESVAGRHMIFRLRKRDAAGDGARDVPDVSRSACTVVAATGPNANRYSVAHDDLFQNGRLVVKPPDADQHLFDGGAPLDHFFETRQGIAENPPCVTRRLCQEFPGRYKLGAGVFVLSAEEIAGLNLLPIERELLRPYFDTRVIRRYSLPDEPTHQILYLTRRTASDLDRFPAILAHLAQYRPILERRREVQLGRCAWWHLHWPRDEQIFLQPKVFSVQMGMRPQFAFCFRPAFVGFSINVLRPGPQPGYALEVLTGILNSDLAFGWFDRHAKRRGVNLEINAHLLRQFPLPSRDERFENLIAKLVGDRQTAPDQDAARERDAEIERLVRELYVNR